MQLRKLWDAYNPAIDRHLYHPDGVCGLTHGGPPYLSDCTSESNRSWKTPPCGTAVEVLQRERHIESNSHLQICGNS